MGLQKCEKVYETVYESLLLELPLHLLYDILSRLPFEDIFVCRCVCRKFLKLLGDSFLDTLNTTIIVQDKVDASDLFLAHFNDNSCTRVALTLPKKISEMKNPLATLVGSCNGLLCIRYRSTYYVCNPILGEFMVLPIEMPSSMQASAFGYCPKTKQYKVIQFVKSLYCKIHTLGTSIWRKIDNVPPPKAQLPASLSLNGNLHWITNSKVASNLICSFNLETEQFLYMPPPRNLNQDMFNRIYNISVGALAGLFSISYVLDSNRFEIWVMKKYGIQESWIKKISIDIMSKGLIESTMLNYPMKFLNNGDLLIKCDKTSYLYSYSIEKDEFKVLMDTGIYCISVIAHLPKLIHLKNYAAGKTVEVVQRKKTSVPIGC